MDVEQRLAEIDRKQDRTCMLLETLTSKVDDRIGLDDGRYQRYARIVYGENGGRDKPGLLVRLDRLEQTNRQQAWAMRIVGSVIIVGLIGGVLSLVMG